MTRLPAKGELATREALEHVRVEFRAETRMLRREMIGLRSDTNAQLMGFRGEMSDLKQEISGLRQEMSGFRHEMTSFKGEVGGQIHATRLELKEEMRELRATMQDYEVALRGFVRTFVTTQAAGTIAVVGIVLGIERLT